MNSIPANLNKTGREEISSEKEMNLEALNDVLNSVSNVEQALEDRKMAHTLKEKRFAAGSKLQDRQPYQPS